jgi:hypothetical protein
VGPRRTLQLAMVVAAIAALVLALSGAFSPSSAVPVDAPAVLAPVSSG